MPVFDALAGVEKNKSQAPPPPLKATRTAGAGARPAPTSTDQTVCDRLFHAENWWRDEIRRAAEETAAAAADATSESWLVSAGRYAGYVGEGIDAGGCLTSGNGMACTAAAYGLGGIAGDIVGGAVGGVTGFGIRTFGAIALGVPGAVLDIMGGIEGIRHFCGGE